MKERRIVASIQARMNSSRLPGKVMKMVVDKPLLQHQIERVKRSKLLDGIVIATSQAKDNDVIEKLGRKLNVDVFRGSEDDVLGRLVGAIKSFNIDVHVELHGDCPFTDPEIIDEFIRFFLEHEYDYISNDLKTTYPPGLEVAVYDAEKLVEAESQIGDALIREHGSLCIKNHPDKYKLYNINAPAKLHYPDVYIELDTEEDFMVTKTLYETFYPVDPEFTSLDIIRFMNDHPELTETNANVERRWKEYRQD